MRRTCGLLVTKPFRYGTGLWDEDNVNEYNSQLYSDPRAMKYWYARHEYTTAGEYIRHQKKEESLNHHEGLHYSGDGAFERELERKGIPVDKYTLPTSVGVKRLHEMVVLRRRKLEALSEQAMAKQREAKKAELPSSWYDETDGPLNPNFLKSVQRNYSANISDLGEEPIRHEAFVEGKQ